MKKIILTLCLIVATVTFVSAETKIAYCDVYARGGGQNLTVTVLFGGNSYTIGTRTNLGAVLDTMSKEGWVVEESLVIPRMGLGAFVTRHKFHLIMKKEYNKGENPYANLIEVIKAERANIDVEEQARLATEKKAIARDKKLERCINSNIFNLQHLKVDDFTTSYTDLGNQYFYGKGKEFSIEKAFLCYNYGAKRGEAEAFLLIAQYYETGRAHGAFRIEQDSNIALLFYEKAASLQVQGASEGVKRVQSSK